MEDSLFDEIRSHIDAELASGGDGVKGLTMAFELAKEFRRRGLLEPKLAYDGPPPWHLDSYRGKWLILDHEATDLSYRIGQPEIIYGMDAGTNGA